MLIPPNFIKRPKFAFIFLAATLFFLAAGLFVAFFFIDNESRPNNTILPSNPVISKIAEIIAPPLTVELPTPPIAKTLSGGTHVFQRFNNCGPASLSMALSHYGINESQEKLGNDLRPYQVASGDNDDKSVTLEELAEKSREYGFAPYHRPVGNPEIVKHFIANDMPVITRTWTTPTEDIGHYRLIKGYNETGFIQDDSLQGKDLHYTFADFDAIWKQFNYEYLVLVPQDKVEIAKSILGENADETKAWENAVENARNELSNNPNDIHARFNLSVALANIGEYQESVMEFEKVEHLLSFRTLWYQIEPIQAYYELGNYNRVFEITDRILDNHNRAFSELYIIRGNVYLKQGNIDAARREFELAVRYNINLKAAHDSLTSVN